MCSRGNHCCTYITDMKKNKKINAPRDVLRMLIFIKYAALFSQLSMQMKWILIKYVRTSLPTLLIVIDLQIWFQLLIISPAYGVLFIIIFFVVQLVAPASGE